MGWIQFSLATVLLNSMKTYEAWSWIKVWGQMAIILIVCAVLIYRELRHRQQIQALRAVIQAEKTAFETDHKQVAKKLQESEACLQTLIDNIPFNCWICDAEGKHLMQNAADVQQWGSLVGLRYEEVDLPPETLLLFIENRQRVLNGAVWRSEWQYQSGNEVQTFLSILAPIYNNEEIKGLLGVSIDITEQKQTENELRRQKEQYRRIVEMATEGIWVLDDENRTTFVNQQMAKMLGYSIDEMVSQPLLSFIDESGQEIALRNLDRRRQGIQEQHDFRFRCRDGSDLWALVSATPLFDDQQNYIGALGMVTDVTDRKRIEESLRHSEEQLQLALTASNMGIWDWVLGDRIMWSRGHEQLFGFAPGSFDGTFAAFEACIHPDDRESIRQAIEQARQFQQDFQHEFRVVWSDGSVHWIEGKGRFFYSSEGEAVRMLGTVADISDRKAAEFALRQSEITNRALVSAVPDLLIWIDRDGTYLDILGSSKNLKLTKPLSQLIGISIYDAIPHERAQERMHYIQLALQTGELQVYEYQLEIDGEIRDEEARIVVCGEQQVLCMVRDISDRKRAERELQQKESFLQLLLDTIPEQIFWIDQQSVYMGCNRLYAEIAGLDSTDDIVGKTDYDLPRGPGEADYFRQEDQFILETGQPLLQLVEQKLQANGERIWVRVNKVPIPDAAGNVIGVLGTIEDIHERKQAEEALRSRNQELLTLHQISEISLRNQSSQTIFQGIVEEISAATGFPMVAIELYDSARQIMVFEGMKGVLPEGRSLEVPVNQSLSGTVAKTGQAIVKYFMPGDLKQCVSNQDLSQLNIKTFVCIPMTVNQDTIGVLSLAHPDIIQISADTFRWLESLANYLALITHRQQLEASLQQANVDLGIQVAERTFELIAANQSLQHQRDQWQALFEHALDAIVITDDEGRYIDANPAACQLFGISKENLLRSSIVDFAASKIDTAQSWQQFLQQGQMLGEFCLHRSDGTTREVEFNAIANFIPDRHLSVLRDITERRQAELEIRKFVALVDNSSEFIGMCDMEFRPFYVNEAGKRLLGLENREQFGEAAVRDFFFPEDQDFIIHEFFPRVLRQGQAEVEIRFRHFQTGEALWMIYNVLCIRDEHNQPIALAAVSRNITERKQTEVALQEAHENLTHWLNDLEQRHQEMTLLNELSDLMQACLTVDEASVVIAQFMPRLFPGCSGAVYTSGDSKGLVEAVATWGEQIASQLLFTPNDCFALRRGQPHYVEDTHTSLCCKHLQEPLPSSCFCVPMAAQGETSGVLYLSVPEQPLSQSQQQLATTVARQIALAIANLKLYATLQNQSIRDPLTGLFNRRYLNEFLEREMRRAERNQGCLSLLLLDVDHFKQFNDRFGHDAGDAVLRHLSRFLQESIRGSDIACRYGGEEMVLILPNTSLEDARQRAEQLRQGVKDLKVEHPQSLGAISISVGVACFPAHGSFSEALLQAADLALYQAKATGRDRVVTAMNNGN